MENVHGVFCDTYEHGELNGVNYYQILHQICTLAILYSVYPICLLNADSWDSFIFNENCSEQTLPDS